MRISNRGPLSRRHIRPAAMLVLLWLPFGWAGCAVFDQGQTLVPSRYHTDTGPFVVYANEAMPTDPPAIEYLQALERDVNRELGLKTPALLDDGNDSRVQVYVLDNRQDFDHFLRFYYPELPHRRAFFLAKGTDRLVYTYSSSRLEEDLRHEATHALLRGAFGDLPLWLDEGLAEYFEADLSQPGVLKKRLDAIAADEDRDWLPSLERLEALEDIHEMNQRDYREAWAWVHFLLKGPEPGRAILMAYLNEPDRASLKPRLASAKIDEVGLLRHIESLRSAAPSVAKTAAAKRPANPAPAAFRLQDATAEPTRKKTRRGLTSALADFLRSLSSRRLRSK